ncbi:hypothetical protein [Pseudoxanthomonas koreensis]|uniref:hypothetical protein n=1 Tax=Pseudoxanthomonas koreensis TaxID=266061 RepID=UPI001390BC34|nr:hypothetical protein [Pseudoxanthomonas koreensis]KAF1697084.1 hypothetical protein CSC64_00975 [Pseudoxanthomonas koreensis]
MGDERTKQPFYAGTTYRRVSAVVGTIVVVAGFYALLFAETDPVLRIPGGIGIILIGGNLAWSAWKARESWLSRIGPLP